MKTIATFITWMLIMIQVGVSQTPESISYQAAVRDNNGNLLANQLVSFRISVLQGGIGGTTVFSESHLVTTNAFGLATLKIGQGTLISGNFDAISWESNSYFLQVEIDTTGGSSYVLMGTSQFLSVPYALYAKKAASGGNVYTAGTGLTLDGNTFNSVWTQNSSHIFSNNSGNIGIGTSLPGQQLEITQSLKIPETTSSATGIIFKGSNPFLHNFKPSSADGNNIFLGPNAGNFSLGGGSGFYSSANIGIGTNALHALTTGFENTSIGTNSLSNNTTGYENIAMGNYSMIYNTTGTKNVSLGNLSSCNNTSGSSNTNIGYGANFNNDQGSNNTIIGYQAGRGTALHTKSGNVFLGFQAGYNETGSNKLYIENSNSSSPLIGGDFNLNEVYINGKMGIGTTSPGQQLEITQSIRMPATTSSTTGVVYKGSSPFIHNYKGPIALGYNTFVGIDAGNFTSGGGGTYHGCNNTGFGQGTLSGITSGYANTAVGAFTLQMTTTGYENTGVGLQALYSNTTGTKNTGVGYFAMHENTNGIMNTSLGFGSNYYNQGGSNNTIIGYEAGRGTAAHSKSGNVFIGYQAGYSETGSNKLYIENSSSSSPLIGGDFTSNEVQINGRLGVGVASPHASAAMEVASTTKGFLPPRMSSLEIQAISSPAAGLIVFNTSTGAPNYFDGTVWKGFDGSVPFPQIGSFWEGGIVFYLDGTGEHGLVAQETNQAYNYFGCIGILAGATQTALFTGDDNTVLLAASSCGDTHAADACNDLVLNGKSDWYLPAKDELNEMYTYRTILGMTVTGWAANYWSSTESNDNYAWHQNFETGNQSIYEKGYNHSIRCVRAF